MTKTDVLEKIKECKKCFTKHADIFFKLNDPHLFSEISDSIERAEMDLGSEEDDGFLTEIYDRFQNFIDMIESTEYFYTCGKYNLTDTEKKRFSHGIRTHLDKTQTNSRKNMDQDALKLIDLYVDNLDFLTTSLLKKIPISEGCMALYKSLNFVTADKFCDENEAGVTISIRIRATVRPNKGEEIG